MSSELTTVPDKIFGRRSKNLVARMGTLGIGWWTALLPLSLLVFFARYLPAIARGETVTLSLTWVPSLDVSLSFYLDGLALVMALLVTGIGALVYIYAGRYLAGDTQIVPFYAYVTLFMVSMVGLVTAGNLLTLFVFWELTSISSYLLIGFKHRKKESRDSALQALLVTGGGGLALLAGFLLMGMAAGTYDLPTLLSSDALRTDSLYLPILVLVGLGAFTKSAQVPFHFWLPGAMAAPTPVSAYLHSATMVKAGVYLLARLHPAMGGTSEWTTMLVTVGGLTMVVGAYLAWQQQDLKRILAFSTVSSLGTLVLLLGIGTPVAVKAAIVFLVVHSLYKGALFLVAGSVDHATGVRQVDRLGKLGRAMPWTAGAAGLAALSMAGLPPFLGFVGKELIYEATLYAPTWALVLTGVALVGNTLNVVVAGLVAVRPFWAAPKSPLAGEAHEGGLALVLGPVILAAAGLIAGLFLVPMANLFVAPAAGAVAGEAYSVKLSLWHGLNPMLALSVITVALGLAIYTGRDRLLPLAGRLVPQSMPGPDRIYGLALAGLKEGAYGVTTRLQTGHLRRYVRVVLMSAVALVGGGLLIGGGLSLPQDGFRVQLHEVLVAIVILAAAVLATRTRSRLTAVAALGVVGFGMSIIFVLFGAPDLAMTQFAVETLTVLLFVLVLYRLPRFDSLTTRRQQIRDAVVALGAGTLMTLIVLSTLSLPHPMLLTDYFAENSLSLANGRNVVNVILVDFRSLDTLGELVVLAVAATGVYALMKLRMDPQAAQPLAKKESEEGGR